MWQTSVCTCVRVLHTYTWLAGRSDTLQCLNWRQCQTLRLCHSCTQIWLEIWGGCSCSFSALPGKWRCASPPCWLSLSWPLTSVCEWRLKFRCGSSPVSYCAVYDIAKCYCHRISELVCLLYKSHVDFTCHSDGGTGRRVEDVLLLLDAVNHT